MRNLTFAVAAALLISAPAIAGVTVTQESTTNFGGGERKTTRTMMIQGNKEKVAMENQTLIIDLDKNLMTIVNDAAKTYSELPFPPSGPMAAMFQGMSGLNLQFKKTGGHQTLIGYQCDEYTGAGHMMMGDMSLTGCFSKDAPGAGDYSAFTKQLAAKFKTAGVGAIGGAPDGVPLTLKSSTKVTNIQIPGMSPEQAKMIAQSMANRPPTVSTTTTTGIKAATFASDTFAAPSGFTKKEFEMGMPPGAMGGSVGGGAPGASAGGSPASP